MTDSKPQYITIEKPPEKAGKFRRQMKQPYFKAQVNANVYLVNNLGHLLLTGEPELVGGMLKIPVHHRWVDAENPVPKVKECVNVVEAVIASL